MNYYLKMSKKANGKSACEEMAVEIARLAQNRVVEVDRVSFKCGSVTLKMVKTTTGLGWVINDTVLFPITEYAQVANTFYYNLKVHDEHEAYQFNVRFGDTDTVVWRVHRCLSPSEVKKPLAELVDLLKSPPSLVE